MGGRLPPGAEGVNAPIKPGPLSTLKERPNGISLVLSRLAGWTGHVTDGQRPRYIRSNIRC